VVDHRVEARRVGLVPIRARDLEASAQHGERLGCDDELVVVRHDLGRLRHETRHEQPAERSGLRDAAVVLVEHGRVGVGGRQSGRLPREDSAIEVMNRALERALELGEQATAAVAGGAVENQLVAFEPRVQKQPARRVRATSIGMDSEPGKNPSSPRRSGRGRMSMAR
jgi:hypothetical protein